VAAAVIYGILHDQITVRICLEYFTIGHPAIFGDQSPTMLAVLWGTVASWWMGLFLGIILALSATVGSAPAVEATALVKPLLRLLVVMALCAIMAGLIGFGLASIGKIGLPPRWQAAIPRDKQKPFLVDAFAHEASYGVGFLGSLFIARKTWVRRKRNVKATEG
jgi:hypothetical protein